MSCPPVRCGWLELEVMAPTYRRENANLTASVRLPAADGELQRVREAGFIHMPDGALRRRDDLRIGVAHCNGMADDTQSRQIVARVADVHNVSHVDAIR